MNPDTSLIAGCAWYALAFWAALASRSKSPSAKKQPESSTVYLPYACFLAAIGFGTLTDLGQQGAQAVRTLARAEGWYRFRADVQVQLMLAIVVVAALATLAGLFRAKRHGPQAIVMTGALAWTIGFQSIRGISLHAVDALMGRHAGPLTVAQWGTAIGLGLAALPLLLRPKK